MILGRRTGIDDSRTAGFSSKLLQGGVDDLSIGFDL